MEKESIENFAQEQALEFFVGTKIKPECIKANDYNVGSGKIKGQCLHSMALEVAQKYKIAKSLAKDFI